MRVLSFALALCPGCFRRPTGDLRLQLCRRTDHVETWSPPYVVPYCSRDGDSPVRGRRRRSASLDDLQRVFAARELRRCRGAVVQGGLLDYADFLEREDGVVLGSRLRGPDSRPPGEPAGHAHRSATTSRPRRRHRALLGRLDWAAERGLETLEAVLTDDDRRASRSRERRGFAMERREKGVALDLTTHRAAARRAAARRRDRHLGRAARARARLVRGRARGLAGRSRLRGRGARAVRGLARARHAGPGRPAGGDLRRGRRRRGRRLREVLPLQRAQPTRATTT